MKKIYIIPTCTNESVKLFGDLLEDPNTTRGSLVTRYVDSNEGFGDYDNSDDQNFLNSKSSLWDE